MAAKHEAEKRTLPKVLQQCNQTRSGHTNGYFNVSGGHPIRGGFSNLFLFSLLQKRAAKMPASSETLSVPVSIRLVYSESNRKAIRVVKNGANSSLNIVLLKNSVTLQL
jgi:hypothetical protein